MCFHELILLVQHTVQCTGGYDCSLFSLLSNTLLPVKSDKLAYQMFCQKVTNVHIKEVKKQVSVDKQRASRHKQLILQLKLFFKQQS